VITKAGVLGVARLLFCYLGVHNLRGTWVQTAFMSLALLTVFTGSLLALRENHLKRRLAWSSVSQVSYILFGLGSESFNAAEGKALAIAAILAVNLVTAAAAILDLIEVEILIIRGKDCLGLGLVAVLNGDVQTHGLHVLAAYAAVLVAVDFCPGGGNGVVFHGVASSKMVFSFIIMPK
jgi:NADH:ubiquinone oxidoreductase subunit 2 (subunit N)